MTQTSSSVAGPPEGPPGFLRSVVQLTSGGVATQVLMLLTTPLLTRIYAPAEFGVWHTFLSVTAIASVVAALRYELSVVVAENDEEAVNALSLSILLSLGTASLSAVVLGIWGTGLIRAFDVPELASWLWAIPLAIAIFGAHQSAMAWCTRRGFFSLLSASYVTNALLTGAVQIGAGLLLVAGAGGLIAGPLAGQTIVAILLFAWIAAQDRPIFRNSVTVSRVARAARKFANFPRYVAPYSFLGNLKTSILFLGLAAFSTTRAVGLLGLAFKVTYSPITVLGGAMTEVFYNRVAATEKHRELQSIILSSLKGLAAWSTPAVLLFVLNADFLFGAVFGASWVDAGRYAAILAAPHWILLFTNWLDRFYFAKGRQKLALGMESAYCAVAIAAFGAVLLLHRSPLGAVAAYSATTFLYNVVWLVVTFRLGGFSLPQLARVGMATLAIAGASAAVLLLAGARFAGVARFAATGGVVAIYYSVLLLRLLRARKAREPVATA